MSTDLSTLLEYASIRFADGTDLAQGVLQDVEDGHDPLDIRADAAHRDAFLTAYFADCLARLRDAT